MFNRKNSIQDLDAYVEERLSDYLDGTLSGQERAVVEAHLATSARARASLESLRYTVNLLKQTPAPVLPRQFTLPVTARAPMRASSGWLVWGLRGAAAAATAAFAILLVVTLWRQQLPLNPASAPAAQTVPSVVIAMAQPSAVASEENTRSSANDVNATPIMVTEEPSGAAMEALPVTVTPEAAQKSQVGQADSANAPPTAQPAPPQPTSEPPPNTQSPPPPSAAAAASGVSSAAPESAGATATATLQVLTQRTSIALEGEVILSELKVREGPGTQYRTIGGLRLGDRVIVLGRSRDDMWLLIDFTRNARPRRGWVSGAYIRLNGELGTLPETEPTLPEPLTVTPTPTETPTPELPATSPDQDNETPTPTPAEGTAVSPVTPVDAPTLEPGASSTVQSPEMGLTGTLTPEPEPARSGSGPTPEK